MAFLELRGIRRTFGGFVALDSIDLDLDQGEFLSLLGPSGCGKTTALRLVAGFDRPDAGTILVDGKDLTPVPPNRRDMGMVFQAYSLFPNMTAQQNVEFGLRIRGQKKGDRQGRVGELLELVGLGHATDRYPHQLSGGMQQRVALARALAIEPQPDFGFVFQQPNLMPWRNVLDNVLFPMEILGRRDAAAKTRAQELLGMVGLVGFDHARPHQLSGGMQQRVALCRALIHKPALLLMDEPFGALDELTRMEMNDLLHAIRAVTRATVVFVTHSIAEAVYLSDQVLVFSKRPARIAEHLHVDIPYPRSAEARFTARFTEFEHRASRALGVLRAGPSHATAS